MSWSTSCRVGRRAGQGHRLRDPGRACGGDRPRRRSPHRIVSPTRSRGAKSGDGRASTTSAPTSRRRCQFYRCRGPRSRPHGGLSTAPRTSSETVRAHGGDKLRWVDVGPNGRVVVVGAGRGCEGAARRPRRRSSIAPRRPPRPTWRRRRPASRPRPPRSRSRHRPTKKPGIVEFAVKRSTWVERVRPVDPRVRVAATVDNGSTALVHADCRAGRRRRHRGGRARHRSSAPRTVSPRAVSPAAECRRP